MPRMTVGTAALVLLLTFVFATSAQATGTSFTSSTVTSPADGTLEFQNIDTNPNATITVSGTTNWTAGESNLYDIGCYSGGIDEHQYEGTPNSGAGPGLALNADGSFSVTVPQSFFAGAACELLVVPHGTSRFTLPPNETGPRVSFSGFQTYKISSGANSGTPYDYFFDDATLTSNEGSYSIDDCGPYQYLVDGSSALNSSPELIGCGGNFYNSTADFYGGGGDLTSAEIQVDGNNAYGSGSAQHLFTGSQALPGFPALTASLDSFDTTTRDAQTTESEPLVECTPDDVYNPTASDCTAFASTGVTIKRVTDYTNDARVATVTDTFTSTDGKAHSLALQYEDDGPVGAGWQFPGQASPTVPGNGQTEAAPSSTPGTVYMIDTPGTAPSLSNPMSAITFATPYQGASFDDTIYAPYAMSALFDYQVMVPAGGSTAITFSYASGASLAEVQGYAADAQQPPAVAFTSPASGATVTNSPVTVSGSASAGSGVQSVTVNGVTATVSGGNWSASVPLTSGQNTLTATLTSNTGDTTSVSETVTYTPPPGAKQPVTTPPVTNTPLPPPPAPTPRITVAGRRFNGKAVLVKLACAGANCSGTVTLRAKETVTKKHRKHTVMVVVASKHYSLSAGQTTTVTTTLNGTGKRLLKAEHKLPVRGAVSLAGLNAKAASAGGFSLTLKQPAKKKHR